MSKKLNEQVIASIVLISIGIISSIGAYIQNNRLFTNAATFVTRAAFLEKEGKFLIDSSSALHSTLPPNTYMNQNLYTANQKYSNQSSKFDLKNLLSIIYLIFLPFWMWIGFKFISALI